MTRKVRGPSFGGRSGLRSRPLAFAGAAQRQLLPNTNWTARGIPIVARSRPRRQGRDACRRQEVSRRRYSKRNRGRARETCTPTTARIRNSGSSGGM